LFMKIKTIYRMTALIVLIVLLFSSGAGIVPARAENRRKVTKKLQEIMQDKEPDTPIDFVFIELKIDDDDYEKAKTTDGISVSEINGRSNFDLKVYKGNVCVAKSIHTSSERVQNLRAVEFIPSNYGYGTYTIKVIYQDIQNSTESFSLAWY